MRCCTACFGYNEQVKKNRQIGCCQSMCLHDIRKNRFTVLFCEKLTFKTHNVSFRPNATILNCLKILFYTNSQFLSSSHNLAESSNGIVNSKHQGLQKKYNPLFALSCLFFVAVKKKKLCYIIHIWIVAVSKGRASTRVRRFPPAWDIYPGSL